MNDEFQPTLRLVGTDAAGDAAADDDIGHYLVMVTGSEPHRLVEIGATPVTIGRSPDQTLVLSDSSLSRRHARISLVDGDAIAEDLGSTNGTFVDSVRVESPRRLEHGSVVRLGDQLFKYERRSRQDVRRSEQLHRDLLKARQYVLSQFPEPLRSGAVRTDWCFVPSAQLGGDAFGYEWIDASTFAFFLLDVSGHGVEAAMHSVAVMNVIRQRALSGVDWRDPGQVLATLNDRFQMDSHNGMLLTMWYGAYDVGQRTLSYSAAGHHPAYLLGQGATAAIPVGANALMIGALSSLSYRVQQVHIPANGRLYLFSDGAFELTTKSGSRWTLPDLVALLDAPPVPGVAESQRLYQAVRAAADDGHLEDDCSILVVTFP